MFKEVSSDKKLLLAGATITIIGIYLPWVEVHEAPIKGISLKYGANV